MMLKVVVIVCAMAGVIGSVLAPDDSFMGGPATLLFFTIQSNIWIAIVCLVGLIRMVQGKKMSRNAGLAKFVFTISITLTGMVFCFMLAPTLGKNAFDQNSVNCHVIVPIAAVADFLLTGGEIEYKRKEVWLVALPPLYYTIFAAIGYVCNWQFVKGQNYPYFFLNWGSPAGAFGFCDELPYLGVVWWILILLGFLLLCGELFLALVRKGKWLK